MPVQRLGSAPAESNEWNGYDPFVDAASPVSWHIARPTPSLKDKY